MTKNVGLNLDLNQGSRSKKKIEFFLSKGATKELYKLWAKYCGKIGNQQSLFNLYETWHYCNACLCLEEDSTTHSGSGGTTTSPTITPTSGACNQGWIGDGYCDDINNNVDCNFDGGDCCGANVNTDICSECLCLEGGGEGITSASSGTTSTISGECYQGWIGDGYCDEINNNIGCNFDGGDCLI